MQGLLHRNNLLNQATRGCQETLCDLPTLLLKAGEPLSLTNGVRTGACPGSCPVRSAGDSKQGLEDPKPVLFVALETRYPFCISQLLYMYLLRYEVFPGISICTYCITYISYLSHLSNLSPYLTLGGI